MKKIKLDIIGLSYSQTQSGAYALILGEAEGNRRLPIIIGSFEAQAIAIEIEKLTPTRPLTHDLFKSFADQFKISVKEIIIYNLVDGIFYSKIICERDNKIVEIDSRTSDAVAIAVRFKVPIYSYEFILSSAGILIEGADLAFFDNVESLTLNAEVKPITTVPSYANMSDEELQAHLLKAIDEESYEKAAQIRDEISKRKSS